MLGSRRSIPSSTQDITSTAGRADPHAACRVIHVFGCQGNDTDLGEHLKMQKHKTSEEKHPVLAQMHARLCSAQT